MTPVRPRARKGEGDRLRTEILEATEDLLVEIGSDERMLDIVGHGAFVDPD